ncbi:MAG: type II toxin-antitoxin system HicA family toxin [Gammaproteobacteria bacterium]|nr:type II toxin-antitoxin system HicA family toxin [Gammaproteobacteria bacterium]QOJ33363.1 MAG: type II toxin-antitoxin system HicA family toxin [Gammaproteobacteria bacterium]
MPPKVRELISRLTAAGFVDCGGKGSHRNFRHPKGTRITVSGKPGGDAKPYQEKAVMQALRQVSE